VGEGVRFGPAVAEFPGDAERALVVGGGFAEAAQMVLGVAQGVPRISATAEKRKVRKLACTSACKSRSALKRSHFRCNAFAYQKLVVK
jgi:hypothetical protein